MPRNALSALYTTVIGIRQVRRAARQLASVPSEEAGAIMRALSVAATWRRPSEFAGAMAEPEALRRSLASSPAPVETFVYSSAEPAVPVDADLGAGRMAGITVKELVRHGSIHPIWGRVLFSLVRELRPLRCLELGTSLGVSTAYQAVALRENRQGTLLTLEGSPSSAAVARESVSFLGLENVELRVGLFEEILAPILAEQSPPFDFAFVDGHHDQYATIAYFRQILRSLAPHSTVVLDDIDWSPGMARAWAAVQGHSEVKLAVDAGRFGICSVVR